MDYRVIAIQALIARDGDFCGVCSEVFESDRSLEIDHKIALHNGGSDAFSNLQLVHARCNKVKGFNGVDKQPAKSFSREGPIAAAIIKCDGNKKAAARMLGISRATLYRHLYSHKPLN